MGSCFLAAFGAALLEKKKIILAFENIVNHLWKISVIKVLCSFKDYFFRENECNLAHTPKIKKKSFGKIFY